MAIFVDENDQGPGAGPDRRPGPFPRPAQPGLRHPGGGRGHARQGRPGRRGHPGVRHRGRGRRGHRRQRQLRVGAAPGRRRRPSWRRPRPASPFVVCITEGIPAHDEARVLQHPGRPLPGHPAARARTARGSSAPGKCNIGITAGEIALPGGPVGIVQPVRDPHLPGPLRAQAAGRRRHHLRRASAATRCPAPTSSTAWPPSRPTRTPWPSPCSARSAGRRRRRRPTSSPPGDQAGRRLHRRRHRPAGQEDGPRRRHHLRFQGHRPGQDGGPGRAGVHVVNNPTEAGEKMAEIVKGL